MGRGGKVERLWIGKGKGTCYVVHKHDDEKTKVDDDDDDDNDAHDSSSPQCKKKNSEGDTHNTVHTYM